ncbi:MAG TPA: cobalt ECF transporter T component CbiQ [Desulfobulbaceae bacterium]|nr:MAG: cobalt ECF transporter T component CbiQ [Deltaproteobacteria bacterium RIFOXYD12_FULL_53_23]HCC54187.1 cobalt ECF transporter T component CbiQ [Desulfobulbaceae bacterium]
MESIAGAVNDFRQLDLLATGNTGMHRLDARAKVLVTLIFILAVVSLGKYELAALFPFFLYPAVIMALGNLPIRHIARKVVVVLPFALMVGLFNPLFDQTVLIRLGPLGISGGWLSCASILVRSALTVGAALILVGITGFPAICQALDQLGMPRIFTVQLLFLYRYLFVLTEVGGRTARARELRAFGNKGLGLRSYGSLLSNLLLRTWLRAERIHLAMLARGFTGEFHPHRITRFGSREFLFLAGWAGVFLLFRLVNVSQLLGAIVTGGIG